MGNLSSYHQALIEGQCHPELFVVVEPKPNHGFAIRATAGTLDQAKDWAGATLEHFAVVNDSLIVFSR